MNQHLGASYALSVMIVVAFAVLMAGSDRAPTAKAEPIAESIPPERVVAQPVAPIEPISTTPVAVKSPTSSRLVAATVEVSPVIRPVSQVRALPPARPKSDFATVADGETLAEVARRVYGRSADVAKLWRANRDQLSDVSTPPRVGMTLRTP